VDKDKTKRRVVSDLSFPPGRSVNDGIPKDTFLDVPFHLTLPRSADFVNLILSKGPGSFLYKKDLKRAYRQIPVDPKDYKFLDYKWRDSYYFDLVLPFGLRSATMACQRTTTAVAYIFKSEFNFACFNHVDDFGGVGSFGQLCLSTSSHSLELLTYAHRLKKHFAPSPPCHATT